MWRSAEPQAETTGAGVRGSLFQFLKATWTLKITRIRINRTELVIRSCKVDNTRGYVKEEKTENRMWREQIKKIHQWGNLDTSEGCELGNLGYKDLRIQLWVKVQNRRISNMEMYNVQLGVLNYNLRKVQSHELLRLAKWVHLTCRNKKQYQNTELYIFRLHNLLYIIMKIICILMNFKQLQKAVRNILIQYSYIGPAISIYPLEYVNTKKKCLWLFTSFCQ